MEALLVRLVGPRHAHNLRLFTKFAIVGGSGVVVNLAVFVLLREAFGNDTKVVWPIPGTDFNVRNYHLYSTVAFLVANSWNYLLNRWWTFRSRGVSSVRSEYVPFLVIGIAAQVVGLVILTVLVHAGMHTVLAQLVTIVLVTPVSFVGNKLWTFGAVRHLDRPGRD